jgi:hypothetical protein
MMGVCVLTIGALLAAADEPEPADWIRRLGSDRFAERVEAARALERLGPAALPALRAARDSANPKVRARVAALLETLDRRAEVDRLTRPTLIRLDFRHRPLSEVIDALNARHDLGLALQFGPLPPRGLRMGGPSPAQKARESQVRSRRVTLVADGPLPFWEAIDRLCEAGHLQHDLHPRGRFGLSKGRFLLFDGLGGMSVSSDSGPFRVEVTDLHSSFESDLVEVASPGEGRPRAPARPGGGGELVVRMLVIPEPGLVVRPVGPPTFAEAVDDRGRSLLSPAGDGAQDPSYAHQQRPTLNGPSSFELSASLRLPDLAGRSIRRLRGSIPVAVVAYASDPIRIPLEGDAGKSVRNDEVTVGVLEVARDENAGVTVEVEVIPNRPDTRGLVPRNQSGPLDLAPFPAGYSTEPLLLRLELFDVGGRDLALSWNQGRGRDFMTTRRRVRLTPTILYEDPPPDPAGRFRPRIAKKPVPVELRYYGFVQTLHDIRFDFHDIPLP